MATERPRGENASPPSSSSDDASADALPSTDVASEPQSVEAGDEPSVSGESLAALSEEATEEAREAIKLSDEAVRETMISAPTSDPSTAFGCLNSTNEESTLFVAGVGVSAGGLEALERLFRSVNADSGMAFVVVQHLSTEHRSMMVELASKWTTMPVTQAEDRIAVEPNHIYLLPAGKEMIISEGRLLLTDRDRGQSLSLPIDRFFTSLARDRGRHAIAIVLSGTGSDGSRGLQRVRDAGGLVLSQSRESAEFDGMPRSAIDTGSVHAVYAPEEMGPVLNDYVGCPDIDAIVEGAVPKPKRVEGMPRIFQLLRQSYGIDFADYKLTTISRRTERRIVLERADGLEEYIKRLEADAEELSRLYHDLLIGVTEFFRDPAVWVALGDTIRPILEAKADGDEVRIWIAGCAAGPEAYTVAIVIREQLRKIGRLLPVKIFATDVHRESLAAAGAGEYDIESLSRIPMELRKRYFTPIDGNRMKVKADLRREIVFSAHSIVRDPPFTRLDLVTCRNVLIYLQTAAQQKALSLFQFGLRTGGLLLLGNSESLGDLMAEFEPVSEKMKLFRKQRDLPVHQALRMPIPSHPGTSQSETISRRLALTVPRTDRVSDDRLNGYYDALLKEFIPPALLVSSDRRLLHKFGGVGELLTERDGRYSDDALGRLPDHLRPTIVGGFQRTLRDEEEVVFDGIPITLKGKRQMSRITLTPVVHPDEDEASAVLIRFDTEAPLLADRELKDFRSTAVGRTGEQTKGSDADEANLAELARVRAELRYTRENLQALVEELETSNEELQTTNEELIASNEEMQSTNEELNSVNEELYTLNAEYQAKIRELTELSDDVENLLRSTDVHTVFLDRELRLRKFTPHAAELYNLVESDIGRKFASFQHRTDAPDLMDRLGQVLATGQSHEQEIHGPFDEPYLMRILPYQGDAEVGGVVLTLVDVSAIRVAQRRFKIAVESSGRAMVLADPNGQIVLSSEVATRMFRAENDSLLGRRFSELVSARDIERFDQTDGGAEQRTRVLHRRVEARRIDGSEFSATVTLARSDEPEGRFLLATFVDATGRDELRSSLRQKERELQAVLENSSAAIFIKDVDGRYLLANSYLEALNDCPPGGMLGKTDEECWPKEFAERFRVHDQIIIHSGKPREFEEVLEVDGETRTYVSLKFPILSETDGVVGTGGISTDITSQRRQRDRAETALAQRDTFLAVLSHELRNPIAAMSAGLRLLELPDSQDDREWVDGMIGRQVCQLASLTDDLLDVSRVSRGQIRLKSNWVDLRDVVRGAVESARDRFDERNQKLTVDLPSVPAPVIGDSNRLEQIVLNLLTNSARYSNAGDETRLSITYEGHDAVLTVTDEGRGISAGSIGTIFDMFTRGKDARTQAESGLGVGLALTKQLVEQHGGTIAAASDGQDMGSTFTVRLPLTDEEQPEAIPAPAESIPSCRILVIDDNADLARGLQTMLTADGHAVRVVNDGQEALAAAQEYEPDVILLDLGLPGISGWDIATSLREDADLRSGVLIAISGYGQSGDRTRSREAGFDAHLTKPADYNAIIGTIASVLGKRDDQGQPQTSKPRVLLIEDERALRHISGKLLKSLGATVFEAVDGTSAIEEAETAEPTLVLCDLSLPGEMDGCEAGRRILEAADKAGRPRPKVYALSGYAEELWADRLKAAEFDGFISKPISADRIRQLLNLQ